MAGRRRNGDASITRRADGRYHAKRRITDPITGLPKRVSVYGRTEKEVVAKLRDLDARLVEGVTVRDSRTRLGVWHAHWRTVVLPVSGRSVGTVRTYDSFSRLVEHGIIADVPLANLRPSHMDSLIQTIDGTETRRGVVKILRLSLDAAVRDGLLARNPARSVSMPSRDHSDTDALRPADVAAAVLSAGDGTYGVLTAVIAATGMRAGEACALRWADVGAGDVRIRQTMSNHTHQPVPTKTPRSRRTVPIPAHIVALLAGHRAAQDAEARRAANVWDASGDGLVFRTAIGGTIVPGTYGHWLARRVGITPHQLRHAFGTALIESGVSPRTVADILGHASVATTLTAYTHPTRDHHRAAIDLYAQMGVNSGGRAALYPVPDVG